MEIRLDKDMDDSEEISRLRSCANLRLEIESSSTQGTAWDAPLRSL